MENLRLFVRHTAPARRTPLQRLVRLDVWGDTLLGSKVRDELATGYLVLAMVFLFEVAAWSLLFNYIFQGASFGVDWRTIAAFGVGTLWGLGIFAIDKGLIVTDLRRPGRRKWVGFVGRTLMIFVSAIFTAQPIEQLVFRPMIDERLKQETLREEAVAQVQRLEEKREAAIQESLRPSDAHVSPVTSAWVTGAKEKETAQAAEAEAAVARTAALTRELDAAKRESARRYRAYQDSLGTDEEEQKRARWRTQAGRVQVLTKKLGEANDRAIEAKARESVAEKDLADARKTYDTAFSESVKLNADKERALQAEAEAYRQFVDAVRRASYGDPVTGPDQRPLRWKRADFIERNLVLGELRIGRPPRWPDADPAQRAEAGRLFGLGAEEDAGTRADVARSVFWPWLFILLLAGAIPFLTIIFKLTMSEELKTYYSLESQAKAGNPDALMQLQAGGRGAYPNHE